MIIDTHVHFYDGGWPPQSKAGLLPGQMLDVMDRQPTRQDRHQRRRLALIPPAFGR